MKQLLLDIALALVINQTYPELELDSIGYCKPNEVYIHNNFIKFEQEYYNNMKFKLDDRWETSKSKVRYKSWRKSVFPLLYYKQ